MAKYSVPGIRFTEIDKTIRSNSLPGLGIGAIVMKSNKGPVNQRVLTTSYDNFTDIYGQPENLDDYGHFAAENYLAISNQLLTVRTTMGDEGYAQIQYPYTDADLKDTYLSKDTSEFKYINNEDNANLKLLGNLNDVTQVSALTTNDEWLPLNPNLSAAFGVYQKAVAIDNTYNVSGMVVFVDFLSMHLSPSSITVVVLISCRGELFSLITTSGERYSVIPTIKPNPI